MSKKLLARIGLLVIVLFGVTILTFFYTNLSPVDAAEALAVRRYNRPTPQQVELVPGRTWARSADSPAVRLLAVERPARGFRKLL